MAWCEKEARGVESVFGQSALTLTHNYRQDPSTHRHTWTTNTANQGTSMKGEQQARPALQGLSTLGGGYCHDPFPMPSPNDFICPVPPGLTPFISYYAPQVTLINPDYA